MVKASDFVFRAAALAQRTPPIPYAMGGTTPQGMDCRGLVVYLLRQLGHPDYRTAGATSMWRDDCVDKRPLAQADLRHGDLLFIRSGEVSEHMGVYCGAPSCEVVHASATKGCVCASTLKNGWTHAARHRLIDYDSADREGGDSMAAEYIVRAQGGLRQRKTPGGTYMQMIPDGTRLAALQTQGDWTQVSYGGFTGWVSTAYLVDADGAAEAPQAPENTDESGGSDTPGDNMVQVPRALIEALCGYLTD